MTSKNSRICRNCGKEFIPRRKDQLSCSKRCSVNFQARRAKAFRKFRIECCPVCNYVFFVDKQHLRYCSKKCSDIAKKRTQEKWKKEHKEEYLLKIKKWRIEHKERQKELRKKWLAKPATKIVKKIEYLKSNIPTKEKSIEEGNYYKKYTLEEDLFILENWDKLTKKEIALKIVRSYASVYSRWKKLHKK